MEWTGAGCVTPALMHACNLAYRNDCQLWFFCFCLVAFAFAVIAARRELSSTSAAMYLSVPLWNPQFVDALKFNKLLANSWVLCAPNLHDSKPYTLMYCYFILWLWPFVSGSSRHFVLLLFRMAKAECFPLLLLLLLSCIFAVFFFLLPLDLTC